MLQSYTFPARIEMDAQITIDADSPEAARHHAEKMKDVESFDILEERIEILDPLLDPADS